MSEHRLTSPTKGQDLHREELAAKIRELELKTKERRHNVEQASLRRKATVEAQKAQEAEDRRLAKLKEVERRQEFA